MLLKPEPIFEAVEEFGGESARVILFSPAGRTFNQAIARELAGMEHLLLVSGHYEGFDERVREQLADDELSIGDYVLTNGALPVMVVIDAVARLLPGVLGDDESAQEESFSQGLLEYPQYTRPAEFRGMKVPEVLLSGNHAEIARWRAEQARCSRDAKQRRPDCWSKESGGPMNKEFMNQALLDKIESEQFRKDAMDFGVGDTVRVHTKVVEGDKERIQIFTGVVIGRRGHGLNEMFTVRRISYGEGVERVFPLHSPRVDKVEVERKGSVRRAKLTYLRKRLGKGATLVKEKEGKAGAAHASAPHTGPRAGASPCGRPCTRTRPCSRTRGCTRSCCRALPPKRPERRVSSDRSAVPPFGRLGASASGRGKAHSRRLLMRWR